ncbi:CUGBP Elav-like family member 2 isoform X1 [Drosophila elegans]|uniref:CUGBP Elav-like family member 2 isoform X1 n=1 Tax=Drosophila elegans TaxID=30023 RepID=UPI0007E8023B|nr:CUGBP Elav-like family member 2 isoform X1 [Drosophila elegans]XP_017131204.1 CUGBP Elav-like family member 2 isoform X1 [Drosophila elegans]XP_041565437.1 CUGBP Elav-like family member 2 isoform X1 [Drosophila elegans]XP_041565438.1 CUGBP Elav-like family member 2 isoform X1 [Drosophila elegans]
MLFENPAVAAKLPFPYNVPPPLQAAAAAAAAVPNLRFQTPIKAFACLTAATRSVSEMNATSLYAGNPMENAAAAAAAAAAGLIDPHHNRDLHQALVASIANNGGVATIGGGLTTAAAVLKSAAQQSQQAAQQSQNSVVVSSGQDQPSNQEQAQQAALALLKENVNANAGAGQNNGQPSAMGGSNKSGSSGRSTPSLSGGSGSDPAPGKLFVGGLSWQTSSDKLKEYFNMFGTVTDVLIMKDPVTQRSRGFGFITFQEPCTVEKVLKVPIHTLDGKKIDPKHATPKNRPRQANKTKKIFVGGVSQDTSAEEVKAYFSQFGPVEETVMLMDQQTKRHRGFGFVTFENEDVVDRVCEIHFHTIKNKKVECKKAQPKEAVTPAAQLLQKRIMLGTLGVQLPTAPGQLIGARGAGVATMNPLAMLQNPTQLLQSPAAAAAAAQQAALISQNPFQVQNAAAAASMANQAGFGKLLTTYPQTALHSVRYAPYSIPASAATANAALMQAHQAQSVAAAAHHHQQQQQQQHHHQQQQTHNAHVAAAQQQQQNHHNAVSNSASQAHSAAAAAALAANAANGAAGAGAHSLAAAAQQAGLMAGNPLNAAAAAAAAAANPAAAYSNYALANVDMSSFQGVDWSTMYGMGMYV